LLIANLSHHSRTITQAVFSFQHDSETSIKKIIVIGCFNTHSGTTREKRCDYAG